MNSFEDSLERFFVENKVIYKAVDIPIDIRGISYYEDNLYWVFVNTKYNDYNGNLIDDIIDVLTNNFYCNENHIDSINKIINNLRKYNKNKKVTIKSSD